MRGGGVASSSAYARLSSAWEWRPSARHPCTTDELSAIGLPPYCLCRPGLQSALDSLRQASSSPFLSLQAPLLLLRSFSNATSQISVLLLLPMWFSLNLYAYACVRAQRAPLAPARSLGLFMLTTTFAGLGGSAAMLYTMLGLEAPDDDDDDDEGDDVGGALAMESCLNEADWEFALGPGGGVQIVRQNGGTTTPPPAAAAAAADNDGVEQEEEEEEEDGLWDGDWMALLAGESLLAIELLEHYQPTPDGTTTSTTKRPSQQQQPGAKKQGKDEEGGSGSCDAELFVLLLQRYTQVASAGRPEKSKAAGAAAAGTALQQEQDLHQQQRAGKYKAGLVLEALATQRSAALCGEASLPVLLPMLEALLRQPTDTLTAAAAGGGAGADGAGGGNVTGAGGCQHDKFSSESGRDAAAAASAATTARVFLSGESAEEQARSRNAAAESARDAIDTLQLVLGVLLAIFDPEMEQ
eukprot:COSAG06_NODE_169_length_21469_cov_23.096865_1_plen_467_part_10